MEEEGQVALMTAEKSVRMQKGRLRQALLQCVSGARDANLGDSTWLCIVCMCTCEFPHLGRATHAPLCASRLPSSSLLEKQILMRFCYVRAI